MRWARVLAIAMLMIATPAHGGQDDHERHLRVRTSHGPVHIWTPAGYDPQTAATVVYVHGYFANVDDAWKAYRLRDQFRESGLNAMFIACEAPTSERDSVAWSSLDALLDLVEAKTGELPHGRLVAMGHSGAHRTLAGWLDEPRLDTVALIDAAYGDLSEFGEWLDARPDRRLIDVGALMQPATDAFHETRPDTLVVEHFPAPERGTLPDAALEARIVYVKSRMGHMELVTGGVAIPMLLRIVAAPLVPDADRSDPIERGR